MRRLVGATLAVETALCALELALPHPPSATAIIPTAASSAHAEVPVSRSDAGGIAEWSFEARRLRERSPVL